MEFVPRVCLSSPSVSCLSFVACNRPENGQTPVMRVTLFLLLAGLAIAAIVYVISGGHVIFLPLVFLLPLGLFFGRRRRY
jgi:hypothetical protein